MSWDKIRTYALLSYAFGVFGALHAGYYLSEGSLWWVPAVALCLFGARLGYKASAAMIRKEFETEKPPGGPRGLTDV